MKVETPLGDIVDKITILRIKRIKLLKDDAISNVEKELAALLVAWKDAGLPEPESLDCYEPLASVNSKLWIIEDDLRLLEKRGLFGEEFISKARKVYKLNDLRSNLKRRINTRLGSRLTEEKSHC